MNMKWAEYGRVNTLDRMIRDGRLKSAGQAAEDLEVSRRTIERDLEALRYRIGADIVYNKSLGRYEYVGKRAELPSLSLTEREAATIFVAARALTVLTGDALRNDIPAVFNKLLSMIPRDENFRDKMQRINHAFFFALPFTTSVDVTPRLETVIEAVMQERRLVFAYRKPGAEALQRCVAPYYVLNDAGDWYVFGEDKAKREMRQFKLSRMSDLSLADEYFDRPSSLGLREFNRIIRQGFGKSHMGKQTTVQLKISGTLKEWVKEHEFHPDRIVAQALCG